MKPAMTPNRRRPENFATNTPPANAHLSESQLDDLLIDGAAALNREAAAHLAGCAACRERAAAAAAPLAHFRDVSLAWAERRSATLPLRPAQAAPAPAGRAVWAAAAAALAVAIAFPLLHGPALLSKASILNSGASAAAGIAAEPSAGAVASVPSARTYAARVQASRLTRSAETALAVTALPRLTPVSAASNQIARDNRMLAAIDRVLSTPSSPAAFGLDTAASTDAQPIVRD
jgi:hypothetical protein